MTETSNLDPDKNQHITEYLKYYINQEEPTDSAILLTGSWGCGKTYYIDRFIEQIKATENQNTESEQPKYIFKISLFGLKTIADLDNQIGQEICYSLEDGLGQGARVLGKALTAASTVWNCLDTPIKIKQDKLQEASKNLSKTLEQLLFNKNRNYITFIFDDLERTEIPLKELLGHINAFIKRDHIKIILIANEDELTKEFIQQEQKEVPEAKTHISEDDLKNRETYKKFKEKVIGKTFEVQSDLNKVLTCFIDQHQYNDLISPYSNIIKSIYTNHRIQNLRQLKQSLNDFRYLLEHLDENHKQNTDFLKDLISNFFDLKLTILKQHSLSDLFKNKQTNFVYPAEVWIHILLKNDYSEIKEITNQLSYFIPEKEQPLWMRLYFFKTLDDHIFETLSKQLLHDFNTLKEEDYYEYFHIIGLVISWSELKLISETTDKIKQTAQRYLEKHSHNWFEKYCHKWSNFNFNSSIDNYSGYGYQSFKNPNFISIRKLFYQKQEIIIFKIKQLKLEVNTLYYIQQNDITVLNEFLQYKNEHKLIFNQMNLEKFFKILLELNNQQLNNLNLSIHSRYLEKHTPLHFFVSELHFWKQILTKLDGYLNQHNQSRSIRNYHLQEFFTLSQEIINDLCDNKYIFIINLLRMKKFDNLEECLCDNNQYGQLLLFEERGDYINLKYNLPKSAKEELTNFNRILIRRYNNLKDMNVIKAELSFWHKFIKDLEKEEKTNKIVTEEAYSKLILMLKQITQKIEEEILNHLV